MSDQFRVTPQLLVLLEALLAEREASHYGFELSKVTGLKSGTIYPLLARLEGARWLTSGWDNAEPTGRPRRRYYQLTGEGAEAALAQVSTARSREKTNRSRPVIRPAFGAAQ